MTFEEAVQSCLGQWCSGQGRASRLEFWWFTLFCAAVPAALMVLGAACQAVGLPQSAQLSNRTADVFSVLVLIPYIAVFVRRLHDVGLSGRWLLLVVVPVMGAAAVLALASRRSVPAVNQWGAPRSPVHLAMFPEGHFYRQLAA